MKANFRSIRGCVIILAVSAASAPALGDETGLAGLWESQRTFGPELEGQLRLRQSSAGPIAEIGGDRVPVMWDGDNVSFDLRGARFTGVVEEDSLIRGHWLQPPSEFDGNTFATPVRMRPVEDGWAGQVLPQRDTGTFYLLLGQQDDGLAAGLINPERNLGVFTDLTRLVENDDTISLMGRFRGRGDEREMLRGQYLETEDLLYVRYPGRGGAYDFRRVETKNSRFFARGDTDTPLLSRPPAILDGWEIASPGDAGIDINHIAAMLEEHALPTPRGTHDLRIHAVLIARHGKLVVEEYFRGNHRNKPHDSRSASKGVTAILASAAMYAGQELNWDTPLYPLFGTDDLLRKEPVRAAITLRHLVNMNSGLDCDDRNPESAAFEDYLWDHGDELDFYRYTASVAVIGPAGVDAAYCSASANLAGGLIGEVTGISVLTLIDRLVAEPLQIDRYSVPHSPDGHPFMGGGIRWLGRDFLKFPQLLLDDGVWNGQRVIAHDDVERILSPAVKLDGGRDYAYLWWIEDYPYKGGTVRAHFMGGNGGQIAMLIPELDLSIAFNAGNYSDRVMLRIQQDLIPNYILPAITD